MKSVVLCADELSLRHPELIGLEGESLLAQPWLRTFSEAEEARKALSKAQEVEEVWVASSEEVEPINLAAVLKGDRPERSVFLVAPAPSGSLLSRVSSASIDGVLNEADFVRRYFTWKKRDADSPLLGSVGSAVGVRVERIPALQGVGPSMGGQHAGGFAPEPDGKHVGAIRITQGGRHSQGYEPGERDPKHAPAKGTILNQALALTHQQEGKVVVAPLRQEPIEARAVSVDGVTCSVGSQGLASSRGAFLLPVLSGSGGSGKSTVSALMALLAQRAGLNTLLVDLDLQFGDLREIVGYDEAIRADELLASPTRVHQLRSTGDKPAFLGTPKALEQAEEVIARIGELLDIVCPAFDLVVVNTGSFWTDEHAVLLERCSRAFYLVDQRPSSLRACQRALDLFTRCGIAASPLVFVANKCSKQGLYTSIDVSCALHGACAKELSWGGSQIEEMVSAGQALDLLDSRNAFVESLLALMVDVIPSMPEIAHERQSSGKRPLLRMLMSR